ncbi:MAG: hypothetical protein FJ027_14890 [Candidatus Rokubacteria bacterium]|nr:hypothetical protein [Candidatus Rokubacteria bacterium]
MPSRTNLRLQPLPPAPAPATGTPLKHTLPPGTTLPSQTIRRNLQLPQAP